ncbi:M15 family metallopeptidase [Providencia rettgeri]|uniref:M15 family metallopeptidase n=1 Tax=Providencia rettgeri TaxID=587 RepID=UPI000D6EB482|nr:M15 family metallopeptidase [Providencia rettgeri]ELU1437153.1 M15 family metallopeptidase [Providencia rettgeri]MDM9282594.1 M15 family metallopeptidase [Providencia rettgeri]HEM6921238.1 M15 family metallopeptidase [Providencia rettgeri]
MSMVDKQNRFTGMVAKLIIFAQANGYQLTFGEAFRTKEQAALNEKSGKGISKSLHTERLAVDFNLFKDGKWLTASSDHKPLGEYWESIGGSWGGRFNDGNHYSLEHNGVR